MWTDPGKKLLFMGSDFGQWNERNFDERLQPHRCSGKPTRALKCAADRTGRPCRKLVHQLDFDLAGSEGIDCHNHDDSTRATSPGERPSDFLVISCNFTPCAGGPPAGRARAAPGPGYLQQRLGVRAGSNLGNGPDGAEPVGSTAQPYSIRMT